VSAKPRNPKKNPAARRQRGRDMPGLPRARRFTLEDLAELLMPASADQLPLMALPALWLWSVGQDGHAAAHCVDACVTVQYALAEYGIASEIEAVGVGIAAPGAEPELLGEGDALTPHYNEDGTFNGHTVLVIPDAGRLVDPTIQQFDAIPRTVRAAQPMMAPLPAPGGLGIEAFAVHRGDHLVVYVPLPPPYCDAWQSSPVLVQRADEYREVASNLAAKVFDIMRSEAFRERIAQSPYPRLRTLLTALDGMPFVADSDACRFADPGTGREYRLADIPEPGPIPEPAPRASPLGRLRRPRR
jgi:hypothetical protein